MPMLYGQGHKAFRKLQEEIISVSDDHSILAWDNVQSTPGPSAGIACSPAAFRACGDIERCENFEQSSYSITNLGISIHLQLMKTTIPGIELAGLNCCRALQPRPSQKPITNHKKRKEYRIWIPVLITGNRYDNRWLRAHAPFSRTSLEAQFELVGESSSRDIFISTDWKSNPASAGLETQIASSRLFPESSGFFVSIGFGDMDHIQAYRDVYNVRSFMAKTLRQRRPCDISHLLVSSGLFSVILSAVWGPDGSLVTSRHSAIQAKASDFLIKTQSDSRWAIIHDRQVQPMHSAEDGGSKISRLHQDLALYFHTEQKNYNNKPWPLVQASEIVLQDFRGRSELAVKVIFRDPSNT